VSGETYVKRFPGGFVDLPSQTTKIDSQFLNAVEAALVRLLGEDPVDGEVPAWNAALSRFVFGLITNAMIDPAASIARTKLNFGAGLVDADIAPGAAIATSKIAGSVLSPTIYDAKGDLIVGQADNVAARLAVGSNNQIPIADSAQTLGMRWGSGAPVLPPAPGADLAAQNTITITNAFHRLTSRTATIKTINGGVDGAVLVLANASGAAVDIDSTGNILATARSGIYWMPANSSITLVYNASASKWVNVQSAYAIAPPTHLKTFFDPSNSTGAALTANTVYLMPLLTQIIVSTPVSAFNYVLTTSSGNMDLGIYYSDDEATFTRLFSTGGFAMSATTALPIRKTFAQQILDPVPGRRWYLALVCDNGTASFVGDSNGSSRNGREIYAKATSYPLPATLTGMSGPAITVTLAPYVSLLGP